MSGIHQKYHSRKLVRSAGRRLQGWSPKDVAALLKRQEQQCQEPKAKPSPK